MDITANRHGGNTASQDAYTRGKDRHGIARDMILAILEISQGMTSKEIAERTGWALHTFSGRLAELKRDGMIRGTGARRYGAEVLEVVPVAEQRALFTGEV